jgi:hypothetical protein
MCATSRTATWVAAEQGHPGTGGRTPAEHEPAEPAEQSTDSDEFVRAQACPVTRHADGAGRPAVSLHRICLESDVASVSHLA